MSYSMLDLVNREPSALCSSRERLSSFPMSARLGLYRGSTGVVIFMILMRAFVPFVALTVVEAFSSPMISGCCGGERRAEVSYSRRSPWSSSKLRATGATRQSRQEHRRRAVVVTSTLHPSATCRVSPRGWALPMQAERGAGDSVPDAEGRVSSKGKDSGESMESVVEESQSGVGAVSRPVGFQDMEMDQSLLELAQQDYGMMAMLRSAKFKGLIVFLRNIPASQWVTAVAEEYGDDTEIREMMTNFGKLMHMRDYYERQGKK